MQQIMRTNVCQFNRSTVKIGTQKLTKFNTSSDTVATASLPNATIPIISMTLRILSGCSCSRPHHVAARWGFPELHLSLVSKKLLPAPQL
jgi:hypothetical protein